MTDKRQPNKAILFASATLDSTRLNAEEMQGLLNQIEDWEQFFQQLELDGLAPLFFRHCQELGLQLPDQTKLTLKGLVLRHKGIANARYQALEEFSTAMSDLGIDWYALKGLALAKLLYEDESIRPMRDFDILVPKERLKDVGQLFKELGYYLPDEQPSRFMRDSHQLPNAEKKINGFTISVEIHHTAIGRDSIEKQPLEYDDVKHPVSFHWRDVEIKTLNNIDMLHQVSRHLEAVHPGGQLKLINVLDVTGYAEKYREQIDWSVVESKHPHILNTLACLHMISPLSDELQEILVIKKKLPITKSVNNVAEIMQPIKSILTAKKHFTTKLKQLFFPPDWWLHLYYSISPNSSLFAAKGVIHPFSLFKWAISRCYSYIRGG